MARSMHNGGGASNSQGADSGVSIIITDVRLNEQHQLLCP